MIKSFKEKSNHNRFSTEATNPNRLKASKNKGLYKKVNIFVVSIRELTNIVAEAPTTPIPNPAPKPTPKVAPPVPAKTPVTPVPPKPPVLAKAPVTPVAPAVDASDASRVGQSDVDARKEFLAKLELLTPEEQAKLEKFAN